ncbi:chondroitinase-B domain-containing protein [Cohnella sp.]|uniref:chondroitinase-B domain-containing protein n=1 Tax=Cohnella sp. TaxID=1883426 RepID=UPI003561912E
MISLSAVKKQVSGFISVLLALSLSLASIGVNTASASVNDLQHESFEGYGTEQSGYTSPIGSPVSQSQPWTNAVGGSATWIVDEETVSGEVESNHFLRQTDPATYVLTNEYWGSSNPYMTSESITLSGRAKVTGANSTYAGLVARYSGSGSTRTYYRFMMKKNTLSYQFYLEKVTGNSKVAVPPTPGTVNVSGISIPNETLSSSYDSLGYMPLKLHVIRNADATLTLQGFYGTTLVLSGTDTAPYNAGLVGLYSNAGTTAFDDIRVEAYTPQGPHVPDAPTNVSASLLGGGSVKLSWAAAANATGYNVKMSSSPDGPFTAVNSTPVTATTYTASNLSVGQTYYFVVSSLNGGGEGSDSAPAISAVPQTNPPVTVTNSTELVLALRASVPGSLIELENGNYAGFSITGIHGEPDKPIVVKAKNKGKAVFHTTGIRLTDSSYITIQDMDFEMGSASNWVRLTGSRYIRITNNYFHSPSTASAASKSTWVLLDGSGSHHNRIDHNLMENKRDTGKFITFDGARDTTLGTYEITQNDTVEYNIFRNTLPRQVNESEGIRIGVSDLVHLNAYATIQYNVFDHVDSDPEYVSVKSGGNTIRYNYFIESLGTVALRSGNGSSVYGNMFIGNNRLEPPADPDSRALGPGGVRIYGENHKVYNNYFQDLTGTEWDAAITITTGDNDNMTQPISRTANHYIAKNILIANNTFVNNKGSIELGMTRYGRPPENLVFANNLAVGGQQELIKIMTPIPGLVWSGNIMFPQNGVPLITGNSAPLAESEVKVAFPMMKDEVLELDQTEYAWLWSSNEYERLRTIKFKKLSPISPALDASIGDYSIGGPYSFITEDMEREPRAGIPDVGADEFSQDQETDTAPPVWHSAQPLTLVSVAPRKAHLEWQEAVDDTHIVAYNLYQNGELKDIVFGDVSNYNALSLEPGTTYTFQVEAVDQANRKVSSNTISVDTPAFTGVSLSGVPSDIALGGAAKRLSAIAHYEDSSTEDVTVSSAFVSSNTSVVSVSEGGAVMARGLGLASIIATYNGTTSPPMSITVHPSAQTTKVVDADTYVDDINSGNVNTNYNNETHMRIQTDGGKQSGYMKVTVPTLADAVDTVQLRLYVDSAQIGSDLLLRGIVDDSWDPASITAANQPVRQFTDMDLGHIVPVLDNSFVTFDITKFYQSQTDPTLSFRLTMASNDNPASVSTIEGPDIGRAPTLIFTTIDGSTTLQVDSVSGVYSDTVSLKAMLKNGAGQPIPGETVAFKVDGSYVGQSITDEEGTAILPYQVQTETTGNPEQSFSEHMLQAVFSGNQANRLKASESSGVLTVHQEESGIVYTGTLHAAELTPISLSAGVSQQQDGELGDVGNLPVKFTLFKMDANGLFTEYPASVTQSVYVTNALGIASAQVILPAGIYQVRSALVNNGRFLAAETDAIIAVNGAGAAKLGGHGWMDVETPNPVLGGNAKKLHLETEWNLDPSDQVMHGYLNIHAKPQGMRITSNGGFVAADLNGFVYIQGTAQDDLGEAYTIRLVLQSGAAHGKPQNLVSLQIWNGTEAEGTPVHEAANREFNGSITVK